MNEKTLWEIYTEEDLARLEQVTDWYKECLDAGKTERECVALSVSMAEEKGYKPLRKAIEAGQELKPGDKVYAVYNDKTIVLYPYRSGGYEPRA